MNDHSEKDVGVSSHSLS